MLAHQILSFLFQLPFSVRLPRGIEVLNPYAHATVQQVCKQFYTMYYPDTGGRTLLLGINPGRYGGGITGIPFTDPVQLQRHCNIATPWKQQEELSARFVWEMIAAMGGPEWFYSRFYISAISPLGFVKAGKNLNYYDDALLLKRIEPFAVECLKRQLDFGLRTDVCYCIGEGDNLRFLNRLNQRYGFFGTIIPLPHPRFIMQYKLRQKADYIQLYKERLSPG